jgi:acetate CoA/acetoacetate CoA-transferase alpha subunit
VSSVPAASAAAGKVRSLEEALAPLRSGMRLLVGGFGERGFPFDLVEAVRGLGLKDLTIIKSDGNEDDLGVGRLIESGQVRRVIMSHTGLNRRLCELIGDGSIEAEICPQGILAERIRAGGAGLGGILSDIGLQTLIGEGKRRVEIGGRLYMIEEAIRGDCALLHAHRGDHAGNLTYRHAARNFNPLMAMAADYVVVEVEELVPAGALRPDEVITAGVFVDSIVRAAAGP